MKHVIKKYMNAKVVIVGVVLVAALVFAFFQFYRQSGIITDKLIAEHVEELRSIMHKINADCTIMQVTRAPAAIDFLTVKSFAGQEVGPLQLMHPEKWQGPYLAQNLVVQGKAYEIIKNREGYYIVPGAGVRLAGGKVIGKDIIFTYDLDIETLINNKGGLEFEGRPLAVRLPMQGSRLSEVNLFNEPGFQIDE